MTPGGIPLFEIMHISPLIEAKAELTHAEEQLGPIVLSTRIRLARNLSQYPFPGWAKPSSRREILAHCMEALSSLPAMKASTRLDMDQLEDLEKQILVERHLISRELTSNNAQSGVIISGDQSCAVMVNEEDHLRIQMVRTGMRFEELWQAIDTVDSAIEEYLDYAFSEEYGYLTACPTNMGTGLRASAMLHLPGLVLKGHMEQVVRMVNQLGIAVRGLFGEGSDATGSIFQISNQQTLGESERSIIDRLHKHLEAVIEQEENARLKLLEDNPVQLLDKIGRARGILQNGHRLSSEEAMNLLSLIRLGIDLKMIPNDFRSRVDRLLIEAQPGHVQYAARSPIEPDERDVCRARRLREEFAELPVLTYDNLDS